MLVPFATPANLLPRFVVKDNDPIWRPAVSHPGEDAGADVRAYTKDEEPVREVDLRALVTLAPANTKFVLNGKVIYRSSAYPWDEKGNYIAGSVLDAIKEADPELRVICLSPNEAKKINVGFKIALPNLSGLGPWLPVYKIVSRSGLSCNHMVSVINRPGIIDAGYRDWVKVTLHNEQQNSLHFITHGARIAQGLYEVVVDQSAFPDKECILSEEQFAQLPSLRGEGGFGHTGT